MAHYQEGEAGGLRQRVAPVSPGGRLSPPPPRPRANPSVNADWEDENEDDVTDVADKSTLIFKRFGIRDDETTLELPGHAVRRGPALPFPLAEPAPGGFLGPVSLPPCGFDVPWAFLPAASLPPTDYPASLVRANETRTLPPRLGVRPWRVAAALAAAAVLAWVAFERTPGQGTVVVNASDSRGGPVNHLEVFVDGDRTPCTTAPCYVPCGKGLHEVKVIGDGFKVPATQAVAVASRHSTAVNFVGSPSESGIKVSASQDGVTLAVDGKERGPLPQVLRDLVPGDHTIRLAGSERYEPIVRHVTVEHDKVEDLGTVNLKVVKGNVVVSLGTPGARVFIVSGSDRRELLLLPISVDIDTSKTWSLEATKAGYQDYSQPIGFDDGMAAKTYTVTLEPKSTATPLSAAPTHDPGATPGLPAYPAPAAPAPKASPPWGGGERRDGYLNINSIPASTCFLDGKSLGSTPRLRVSVSAGSHTVKFQHPDGGSTKSVVVNVRAGETRLAVTRLN
jgi:serine/threonine-protein kinase